MVDPTPFFRSCVFDMCENNGEEEVLCDQLQAYTDACQRAGAVVHQWRSPDFCRKFMETNILFFLFERTGFSSSGEGERHLEE